MQQNIIEIYLQKTLQKQLKNFHVSNKTTYDIIKDIKTQLYSLLFHWKEKDFREAILVIGSEEGTFYEPHNIPIAEMVVVTIRNSLLEGIASTSYEEYSALAVLKSEDIKEITSKAIEYFGQFDLETIEIKPPVEDYYKQLAEKYPTAFNALIELSKCNEQLLEHDYPKYIAPIYELKELNSFEYEEKVTRKVTIESGIDDQFNESLCNFLKGIKVGKSKLLVVDSFKMLTRNFEKLLKVLEFILTHEAYFATCNYFITADYVSRRKILLKASHTDSEFFSKLKDLSQISKKYESLLKEMELEE